MKRTKNPTTHDLQNNEQYELVNILSHHQIKEFIINQISSGSKLIKGYMYYQIIMIIIGIFFITRTFILALRNDFQPLFYLFVGVLFTFTLLILIHELLHALAFKLTGAGKVTIGSYLKKFIFYAAADQHVLNRNQFKMVALMPFVVVKFISIAGIVYFIGHPAFYFWIFIVCAHSLFCSGDIGMLDYLYQEKDSEIYTFDVQKEKKSYFFRRK